MWLVYLQDTNGTRRLVGPLGLTEEESNQLIKDIENVHTKPHKVDYFKVEYTKETFSKIIEEYQINI